MPLPQQNISALPDVFQKVLLTYVKATYLKKKSTSPWNHHDTKYFAKGVMVLNRGFTSDRAGKYRDYFSDPVMRSGYLSYFLPVNAVKAALLFGRHAGFRQGAPAPTKIRIADIGAGPLTMTIGFLLHLLSLKEELWPKNIHVDAYELNAKILGDGINLVRALLAAPPFNKKIQVFVKTHIGSFFRERNLARNCDYLFLGNFLNEYDERDVQEGTVFSVLRTMGKPGTQVLFLEPGSKKITRDLQALRDGILENSDYRVLGPCLHQQGCPLNQTAKSDWCNFIEQWRAPQFIKDFDEITEMKKAYLVFSYLFLEYSEPKPFQKNEFIAISDVMKDTGRVEAVGCGPAGRVRFILANRDHSANNAAFDQIRRGSYFSMSNFKSRDSFDVDRNVSVTATDKIVVRGA